MRIGSIPYINSLPLIYGLEKDIVKLPPVMLAKLLDQGELDAAMAPSAVLFDDPELSVVPGICIGSNGPVRSVRLYHVCEIGKIGRVAVDIESKTAALLVQVILHEKYGVNPEYSASPEICLKGSAEGFDAELLIGDKALNHGEDLNFIDLGKEWYELTGLPFVYAFWVVRNGFGTDDLVERLTMARERGLRKIEEIIAGLPQYDPDMLRIYFSENIKYHLDNDFLAGFRRFNKSLIKMGLVQQEVEISTYGAGIVAQSA